MTPETTPNPLYRHAASILAHYLSEHNGHRDVHATRIEDIISDLVGADVHITDIDTIISDIIGGRDPMEVFHALVYLYTHKLQE